MRSGWVVGLAVLALLVVPSAAAEMSGPCQATLQGAQIDRLDADDASDAVAVPADEPANFTVEGEAAIERWRASIHYGPFQAPLTLGTTEANATQGKARIPVNGFSWLGSGLYTVSGTAELADGTQCHGEALIDIQGGALDTVLGSTAAAVTALGGLGLLAAVRDGYGAALDDSRDE